MKKRKRKEKKETERKKGRRNTPESVLIHFGVGRELKCLIFKTSGISGSGCPLCSVPEELLFQLIKFACF